MEALQDAIYAEYAASTLATTPLITAMYNTEAPENAVYPYSVFQIVNGNCIEGATGPAFTEDYLVQFNIFSGEPVLATVGLVYGLWAIELGVRLCYDFAPLTVAGYDTLSCVRESSMQSRNEKIWQINIQYRIKLRKT